MRRSTDAREGRALTSGAARLPGSTVRHGERERTQGSGDSRRTRMTAPLAQEDAASGPEHTLTGEFRIHKRFRSKFLPVERNIIVYIPPGYNADPLRRYPVLYMHDGQNLFDIATSVGREWGVDETAQRLVEARAIEPVLIVGVYNTGESRIDEY